MATKSMTAPLAVIKVGGVPIGKMKNIRITETIRRGKVTGLGRLNASEVPALEWDGSMSVGNYLIEFSKENIPNSILRKVQTTEEFVNTILLQEEGVQVDILRKVASGTASNGVVIPGYEIFASIRGCFITRDGFDISEGQISGRDQEFQYIEPILFPA